MKDIREYPFLNWLYNYLEDNKYFKDNDVANEIEKEIYKIFRENKYDFDTMLELECNINALEREYHCSGFLWGYITAVNTAKGITVLDKIRLKEMLSVL